jgi:hypothetical protein
VDSSLFQRSFDALHGKSNAAGLDRMPVKRALTSDASEGGKDAPPSARLEWGIFEKPVFVFLACSNVTGPVEGSRADAGRAPFEICCCY